MPENVQSKVKLAVLCDRVGPYHFARFSTIKNFAELSVVEFSRLDQGYAWDVIEDTGGFQRTTLFSDKPIAYQPIKEVIRRVKDALSELRPQVVAIPGWDAPASLSALRWCLDTCTPTILMSDSQEHDVKRVKWKEMIKGRIVRLHSAGFVGGKPHIAYLKTLGMPESNIVTGVDVVDNDYFAAGADSARNNASAIRLQLSLPEHYFLISCRFVQKKNLFTVLKAYARYRKSVNNAWGLVLLGDGPLKTEICNLREELDLVDSVLMPGFKQYTDLPAYYGLAGAFILASTTEQWGLVVNEAMASGLPVIVSSNCGCVSDLIRLGQNGYIFDPYDINELSRLFSLVSGAECERKELGINSRLIINKWGLATSAKNMCRAAEMALSAPSPTFGVFDKILLNGLIHLQSLIYFRRSS